MHNKRHFSTISHVICMRWHELLLEDENKKRNRLFHFIRAGTLAVSLPDTGWHFRKYENRVRNKVNHVKRIRT